MEVVGIRVYPLKSGGPLLLDSAELDAFSFSLDRRFCVVDVNGKMVTQRESVKLALILPRIEGANLVLTTRGVTEELTLPLKPRPDMEHIDKVSHDGIDSGALDCGHAAARWMTNVLGRKVKVAMFDPSTARSQANGGFGAREGLKTNFAFGDQAPFLIVNTASVDQLNRDLKAQGHNEVDDKRFRPNIIVSGAKPWDEDNWETLRIGDLVFVRQFPCGRCMVPTINQDTAVLTPGYQPTKILKQIRPSIDPDVGGSPFFGLYVAHKDGRPGKISVGDEVVVLTKSAHPLTKHLGPGQEGKDRRQCGGELEINVFAVSVALTVAAAWLVYRWSRRHA